MAFSRKPIRTLTVLRDQYIMGVRQYVPVQATEYADGTLLTGQERCQQVLKGNPYAYCQECNIDLTKERCKHYQKEQVTRCLDRGWYISSEYGHALCPEHKAEELGIEVEDLPE